jgi:glycosyltransferase involved in cell wall biosynthesis
MNSLQISVLIPLLNEEESLPELASWIEKVMDANNFSYEVIFVDDGSTDKSWEVIRTLQTKNPHIKGLKFNKNNGKTAALQTGFQATKGEVIITMDADLQDSPDEIPELYKMITNQGFDLVSGWKKKRKDPVLSKNLPSKLFNWAARKISGVQLHDFNCGLKAYNSKVTKSITIYGEMHRYIPVIAKWNGFDKITEKPVHHQARKYGTTKFGIDRFINGFLDLISLTFVNKFGRRPMHFFGTFGVLAFFLGSVITVFLMGQKVYNIVNGLSYRNVTDNPFFFIALSSIIIGFQMFLAGFLGELLIKQSVKEIEYFIEDEI